VSLLQLTASSNIRLTIILIVFAVSTTCDSFKSNKATPTPTPQSPAQRVAESESEFQQDWRDDAVRAEARQAAINFLKAKAPDWKIKGVSSEPYKHGSYWVAVDLEKDKRTAVIPFLVRKFFPESGDPYWRVIFLRSTFEAQEHALHDADLLKQLDEAETKIYELENPEPPPDEP